MMASKISNSKQASNKASCWQFTKYLQTKSHLSQTLQPSTARQHSKHPISVVADNRISRQRAWHARSNNKAQLPQKDLKFPSWSHALSMMQSLPTSSHHTESDSPLEVEMTIMPLIASDAHSELVTKLYCFQHGISDKDKKHYCNTAAQHHIFLQHNVPSYIQLQHFSWRLHVSRASNTALLKKNLTPLSWRLLCSKQAHVECHSTARSCHCSIAQ